MATVVSPLPYNCMINSSRPTVYRLISYLGSYLHYGNPWQVWWQRKAGAKGGEFEVKDRSSGVACICRPEAHRMFGEVWFDRDYDVPGVPLRAGDQVLDIGGNQGFFACYAAQRGCRVISFEPDPENVKLLERNLQTNKLVSQVTVIAAAVKGSSGETRLFRTDRLGGGMNTTIPHFAQELGFDQQDVVAVAAVKLADELKKRGIDQVRLCKMDCEGAELEIVQSLTQEDMERVDSFALEFHREAYAPKELVAALERWDTHHIFLASPKSYCERDILYAVHKRVMREVQ